MTTIAPPFDLADLKLLLARYDTPASAEQPRRPPWTWAALDHAERTALARLVEVWVSTYNQVDATTEELAPGRRPPTTKYPDPERGEHDVERLGDLHFAFLGDSTHKMAAGLRSSGLPG